MNTTSGKVRKTKNVRIELEPYLHLRDDEGCVLAHDYEDVEKLAFMTRAANVHDDLLAACKTGLDLLLLNIADDEARFPELAFIRAEIAKAEGGAS